MKLFTHNKIKTGPAIKSVLTLLVLHYSLSILSDGVSSAFADEPAIAADATPADTDPTLKLARLLADNPALGQWSEINRVRADHLIKVAPKMATKETEVTSAAEWLSGHCLRAERAYNRLGDAQGIFTGTAEQYQALSKASNELIACVIALSWLESPEHTGTLPSGLKAGGISDGN